jgi:hypothetical protein
MTEQPDQISVEEQATVAGRMRAPDLDPVDVLRLTIRKFMDNMPGDPRGHNLAQARTKLDEMIFWLRAHEQATARGKP